MVPRVPGVPPVPKGRRFAVSTTCVSLLFAVFVSAAAAQTRERIPFFSIDLHAGTIGLPQAEGWVPVVPADTVLPGRAWGVGGGATVYPFRLGLITFGLGASMSTAKGKGESLTIVSGRGSTATTRETPIVRTGVTNLVPQISINFGHKLGWSYLSAGVGTTKVTSSADAIGTTPQVVVPEAWNSTTNFGGGAKWFMKPHLGAGFDVRFVKLASRAATATLPSAKRTQQWSITAGISIQ
jgi:hypothetical protein